MKALLDLLFENHEIRVVSNGNILFVAEDVCRALGIRFYRDAIARLEDDEKTTVRLAGVPSTITRRNLGGNPNVSAVTESGLYRLIFMSRKPVARRFCRWVTSEVLPQIAKYGSYLPGASPAERCAALRLRWKHERAELLARDSAALAESGLLTIAAFRKIHAVPARDALPFFRFVQIAAQDAGEKPRRFFIEGAMRHAWTLGALMRGLTSYQPRLPLFLPLEGAGK